jgi:hypothetical protein
VGSVESSGVGDVVLPGRTLVGLEPGTSTSEASEALNLCSLPHDRSTKCADKKQCCHRVALRAKDERGAERRVQGCPEGAGEARVAIGDEYIGQAHVTEH